MVMNLNEIRRDRYADSVIEVRIDRCTLATLALFFNKNNIFFNSKAGLGKLVFENFQELLIDNKMVEPIRHSADATTYLENIGLGNLNPKGRGKRQFMKRLIEEDRTMSMESLQSSSFEPEASAHRETKAIASKDSISIEEAKRIGEEVRRDIEADSHKDTDHKEAYQRLQNSSPPPDPSEEWLRKKKEQDKKRRDALLNPTKSGNETISSDENSSK